MSNIQIAITLLSLLLFTSCYNRFSCDESDNEHLGEIDFSTEFQTWILERQQDELHFSDSSGNLELNRLLYSPILPKRIIDHNICESIDIKPYTAYAYFEYDNLETIFNNDSVLINIDPNIVRFGEEEVELLYLTLSYGVSNSLKAAIPVNEDTDVALVTGVNGPHFVLESEIVLNNVPYHNIWVCVDDEKGIYYSKTLGIIAIKMNDTLLLRT